jgi:5-methylcytosine-specific restriction endonuclease McrA
VNLDGSKERDVLRTILSYLKTHRIFHWRSSTGMLSKGNRFVHFGAKGSPDIIAVIPVRGVGAFVGLEVKSEGGQQSEDQIEFQDNLERSKGFYFVVHSLEEAEKAIIGLTTEKVKKCKFCGKIFRGNHNTDFCSQSCYGKSRRNRGEFLCNNCGIGVVRRQCEFPKKGKAYCSRSCYERFVKGKDNPNWRGGLKPINKAIRDSPEYKEWRKSVFERDAYTCQECGQVGGQLHADHIKPFSSFPELRLALENGRTLCIPCHMKTPSFLGGTKYLTRDAAGRLQKARSKKVLARSIEQVHEALL